VTLKIHRLTRNRVASSSGLSVDYLKCTEPDDMNLFTTEQLVLYDGKNQVNDVRSILD